MLTLSLSIVKVGISPLDITSYDLFDYLSNLAYFYYTALFIYRFVNQHPSYMEASANQKSEPNIVRLSIPTHQVIDIIQQLDWQQQRMIWNWLSEKFTSTEKEATKEEIGSEYWPEVEIVEISFLDEYLATWQPYTTVEKVQGSVLADLSEEDFQNQLEELKAASSDG